MLPLLCLVLVLIFVGCDEEQDVPLAGYGIDGSVVVPVSDAEVRGSCEPGDLDCDGYTLDGGDCDDRNASIGPGAIDQPSNGVDEDCRGGDALEPAPACDGPLVADDETPSAAVRALGLCVEQVSASSNRAGLIDVLWERLNGDEELENARQVWLPQRFGRIGPRSGARLLVLSTGVARDLSADGAYTPFCDVFSSGSSGDGGFSGGSPPPRGFPRDSSRCERKLSEGALAYNDVGLRLELRTPPNSTGIAFDSLFLTYEYPDFVCKQFNDFFMVSLETRARDRENIVLDANGDAIGVNTGLLSVCTEASRERVGRQVDCSLGPELLRDTGFGKGEARCAPIPAGADAIGGASTGWLHTEVAIAGGTRATLVFRIWDSADPLLDSTVLLDNFQFLTTPPRAGTGPITTR